MRQYEVLRKLRIGASIRTMVLGSLIALISVFLPTQSKNTPSQDSQITKRYDSVVLRHKRPELSVDYSGAAELKLASRREFYRIGELISLDIAVINLSSKPIFLPKLETLRFFAKDASGKDVDIRRYVESSRDATPDSFQLVQPGEMFRQTAYFLVGCKKEAFENINLMIDAKDDKAIVDRNLFVSWGEGCLNVMRPGKYLLFSEHSNEHVMVSNQPPIFRTATGSVKSNPFKVVIHK